MRKLIGGVVGVLALGIAMALSTPVLASASATTPPVPATSEGAQHGFNSATSHWSTHPLRSIRVRPLLREPAARLVHQRLARDSRTDEAWRFGYARHLRCPARVNRVTLRCIVEWFIGDGVYQGVFAVRSNSRGTRARIGGRVRLTDEYCVYVGNTGCIHNFRFRPQNVLMP